MRLLLHIKNCFNDNQFNILYVASGSLPFKNKFWEIQYNKNTNTFFCIDLNIRFSGVDHAGPRFEFNILGFEGIFTIYDCRHWDNKNNKWQ
jgi:hypothetical protein